MALQRRGPDAGLLHHSDRGVQYACELYREPLAEHGIACSMSRPGNCYDNAVVESFFGTLKTELVHRTGDEARSSVFEWIECWYDRRRRHSSPGYLSPEAFELRSIETAPTERGKVTAPATPAVRQNASLCITPKPPLDRRQELKTSIHGPLTPRIAARSPRAVMHAQPPTHHAQLPLSPPTGDTFASDTRTQESRQFYLGATILPGKLLAIWRSGLVICCRGFS
jgi:hypothetical protein